MAVNAEYTHTLFKGMGIHSYYIVDGEKMPIMWKAMFYHFFNEFFVLLLTVIIHKAIGTTKQVKVITSGIVIWFLIEFIEIFLQILNISDARLYVNDGSYIQLGLCGTIAYFTVYGKIKSVFWWVCSFVSQSLNTYMKAITQRRKSDKSYKSKKNYIKSKKK